jgi:hypothetical protein
MANKLKNLTFKELSLVGRGANQLARVNLFKSADGQPRLLARLFGVTKAEEPDYVEALATSVDSIIKAQGLDPQERLDLLDASLSEFKDAVLAKAAGGLEKDDSDDDDDDTDVEKQQMPDAGASTGESHTSEGTDMTIKKEDVLKGLTPEARAYVEAIEKASQENVDKAVAKADAVVAKAEEQERITVAKSLVAGLPVKAEELAHVLKQLDAPGQETVKGVLAKAAEFAKAAELFEEAGAAGSEAPAASDAISKAAEELRKADPKLTVAQSIAKAYEANPDAYEASLTK